MRTSLPSSAHTVRETAWLLGVTRSEVCRAIRLGKLHAERRRGQTVIPVSALLPLLANAGPGVLRD